MNEYIIPAQYFTAAVSHAAVKDVRNHLKGVMIISNGTTCNMVATDNSRCFIGRFAPSNIAPFPAIIIPSDTVNLALRTKLKAFVLTIDGDKYALAGISFTPVAGKYPDINRAIPKSLCGEPAQYQWTYLADAQKALKTWHGAGSFTLRYNGDGGAVMVGSDAFCVIMPLRITHMTTGSTFEVQS